MYSRCFEVLRSTSIITVGRGGIVAHGVAWRGVLWQGGRLVWCGVAWYGGEVGRRVAEDGEIDRNGRKSGQSKIAEN